LSARRVLDYCVCNIGDHLERQIARAGVTVRKRDKSSTRTALSHTKRNIADIGVANRKSADNLISGGIAHHQAILPNTRGRKISGVEYIPSHLDFAARFNRSRDRNDS
jgi:hypothetical protein